MAEGKFVHWPCHGGQQVRTRFASEAANQYKKCVLIVSKEERLDVLGKYPQYELATQYDTCEAGGNPR